MMDPHLRMCLETGADYADTGMVDVLHIHDFVRLYKLGLPAVCWLTHNGETDRYWNQWQLFEMIRQNNIRPLWMKEDDLNELYGIIPSEKLVTGYPPERTEYIGRHEHGRNHRISGSVG